MAAKSYKLKNSQSLSFSCLNLFNQNIEPTSCEFVFLNMEYIKISRLKLIYCKYICFDFANSGCDKREKRKCDQLMVELVLAVRVAWLEWRKWWDPGVGK